MAREQHSGGSGGTELGRFLRARRSRMTPGDVGLPVSGGLRRTPSLRREEVATLAGISNDYYARLGRGTETRPSLSVVDAITRTLRLDEAEHKHLRDLAADADGSRPHPRPCPACPCPPVPSCCWGACAPTPRTWWAARVHSDGSDCPGDR
ncbi:helix-turn-helix domain-containing protein [Streptomyces sp. NBC_01236]|uniref:helix-turn-helix domain-containing protein n=1 Tax=Streptomyces sp. NBC_01236 TaxID=2903789 RepID=UPI002E0F237F